MPFLDAHIKNMACSQWVIGTWESSKMVPTLTVNCIRHSLHLRSPGRVDLPASLRMRLASALPQCGQTGPVGQRQASTYSQAAFSSLKCGALRLENMISAPLWPNHAPLYVVCKV